MREPLAFLLYPGGSHAGPTVRSIRPYISMRVEGFDFAPLSRPTDRCMWIDLPYPRTLWFIIGSADWTIVPFLLLLMPGRGSM